MLGFGIRWPRQGPLKLLLLFFILLLLLWFLSFSQSFEWSSMKKLLILKKIAKKLQYFWLHKRASAAVLRILFSFRIDFLVLSLLMKYKSYCLPTRISFKIWWSFMETKPIYKFKEAETRLHFESSSKFYTKEMKIMGTNDVSWRSGSVCQNPKWSDSDTIWKIFRNMCFRSLIKKKNAF